MLRIMIDNWWLFACRAAFAFVFALYILFVQGANLPLLLNAFANASIAVLFGLLAFGAGVFTFAGALRQSSRGHHRWLLLTDGLGTCVVGTMVIVVPSLTLVHLVQIIGYWAVFVGICEILMAYSLRRHIRDEWFLVLASIGSLAFGAFLLLGWASGDRTVLTWLGSYALFSASCMSGLAYRLWAEGVRQHARGVMMHHGR